MLRENTEDRSWCPPQSRSDLTVDPDLKPCWTCISSLSSPDLYKSLPCHLPRGWDHRLASNYGPHVWLIGDERRSLAGSTNVTSTRCNEPATRSPPSLPAASRSPSPCWPPAPGCRDPGSTPSPKRANGSNISSKPHPSPTAVRVFTVPAMNHCAAASTWHTNESASYATRWPAPTVNCARPAHRRPSSVVIDTNPQHKCPVQNAYPELRGRDKLGQQWVGHDGQPFIGAAVGRQHGRGPLVAGHTSS